MTADTLTLWVLLTSGPHPTETVDLTILTFLIVVGIICAVIINVRGN